MFSLNIKGGAPIYEQLERRITELIASGVMPPNERLPTVREVAKELGVNPNTVQKTYQLLEQKGLIYSVPSKGSYVADAKDTVKVIHGKVLAEFTESAKNALKMGITYKTLQDILTACAEVI